MKYYTSMVPDDLVERLYKAGCPNIERYERDGKELYQETTYADVFDGLIEKGLSIEVQRLHHRWFAVISDGESKWQTGPATWHESADAAIGYVIGILEENKK